MARNPLVRRLCFSDIPDAMRLTAAAGWNQTEQDWFRMLALSPEGCFCVECDGVVVTTTTAICYNRELAWVGMVLTAHEYRRRGFARLLMNRVLDFLDTSAVSQIKLDATDMGTQLYRSVGFIDECRIERWARQPGLSTASLPLDPGFDLALDREIFSADRGQLLHQLARAGAAKVPEAGFAMRRPGTDAEYFGPCIATSASAAQPLVEWFLARHGGEQTYWDLLPENTEAVRLATEFGFSPARRLTRMTLPRNGAVASSDSSKVFAIAGFEYG
jgi:GNAT superfamily N-acetyltransferase